MMKSGKDKLFLHDDNFSGVFFSIPIKPNPYYGMLIYNGDFRPDQPGSLIWLILAITACMGLIGLLLYPLTSDILNSLNEIHDTLIRFIETKIWYPLDFSREDEIGLLGSDLNRIFIEEHDDLPQQSLMQHDEKTSEVADDNILKDAQSSLNDVFRFLYEKPFPRINKLEAVLFPRKPESHSASFMTGHQNGDWLHIMIVHNENIDMQTALWEITLRERFLLLSEYYQEPEAIGAKLHQYTSEISDKNPGLLYAAINQNNHEIFLFRGGPFPVYLVSDDSEITEWRAGDDTFPAGYSGLEKNLLPSKGHLAIFSPLYLKALGVNMLEFKTLVIMDSPYRKNPKEWLKGILAKINFIQSDVLSQKELIAVISAK